QVAKHLGIAESTLRKLHRYFRGLPNHDVQDVRAGLIFIFDTQLNRFDRFLIEGLIVGILGRDRDCEIVEYRQEAHACMVRLTARRREDLEVIAEAICERVWEQHQEQGADNFALAQKLSMAVSPTALQYGLSHLVDR